MVKIPLWSWWNKRRVREDIINEINMHSTDLKWGFSKWSYDEAIKYLKEIDGKDHKRLLNELSKNLFQGLYEDLNRYGGHKHVLMAGQFNKETGKFEGFPYNDRDIRQITRSKISAESYINSVLDKRKYVIKAGGLSEGLNVYAREVLENGAEIGKKKDRARVEKYLSGIADSKDTQTTDYLLDALNVAASAKALGLLDDKEMPLIGKIEAKFAEAYSTEMSKLDKNHQNGKDRLNKLRENFQDNLQEIRG